MQSLPRNQTIKKLFISRNYGENLSIVDGALLEDQFRCLHSSPVFTYILAYLHAEYFNFGRDLQDHS